MTGVEQHREPYVAATGTEVTLILLRDEDAQPPSPRVFWTWRYANGYGPGLGRLTDRHGTRQAAIERLEQVERIKALAGIDYAPLARGEYEEACDRAGMAPMTDQDIGLSYGVRYGEFTLPVYDADAIIAKRLARRRQIALDAERAALRAAQAAAAPDVIPCPNCGQETPRGLLMNATLGTACPDCWEEMADGDGYGL